MLFFYRFWRGFLRIEIKGDITEKLLNICAKNGIPLWNSKRRGKAIRCYIAVGDFKRLPRLLAKSGLRVQFRRGRGKRGGGDRSGGGGSVCGAEKKKIGEVKR